jgi:DNA mismatch repair protein MutS
MTPLMQQYWEIKTLHPDKILLFRMGDFFEMFFADATTAAPILGIALTQRNKKSQDETPMCGMPYHSIAGPINRLLAQGLKVAICDQIEDPKFAKGLVKRAVTRILTPGMVYDSDTLDSTLCHYLVSFDQASVAYVEPTTGECFTVEHRGQKLENFLSLPVAEIVLSESQNHDSEILHALGRHHGVPISVHGAETLSASERLLSYIQSLSPTAIRTLRPFETRAWQSRLQMSPLVFRHLEIFESSLGAPEGSLFHAINRTQTSAGARLLREYLRFPLTLPEEINERQNNLEVWRNNLAGLKSVRQSLSRLGDIERRLAKISQPTANPRDLLAMAQALDVGFSVLDKPAYFSGMRDLSEKISKWIVEEPPLTVRQGRVINQGVSSDLDELIELSTNSQGLLQALEERERTATQISSLKIRYNNVFGYYIEITNTHKEKAPPHYKRKQTLANAERFYTDELMELEKKVLSAQTRRQELEQQMFDDLKIEILAQSQKILELASRTSTLDVTTALAWLSLEQNYVRPILGGTVINLVASRHPVVEQTLKTPFVANSLTLEKAECLLLTGPNMAGKSTLMRQTALIQILAQMGSYVPASRAELPILEHLFTRIGASDILSQGLSTFMVEMTETAEMLKGAGPHSLVILDEIGRGTSTFDGMSLAQAILEHLLAQCRSYTLFATHYHELTSLAELHPQIQNAHMSVQEKNGEIRFLHTLTQGPALKSYGIHVAELAGLPGSLTKRARFLLKEKEQERNAGAGPRQLSLLALTQAEPQEEEVVDEEKRNSSELRSDLHSEFQLRLELELELLKKIENFSLESSTPLQALNEVSRWKESLKNFGFSREFMAKPDTKHSLT